MIAFDPKRTFTLTRKLATQTRCNEQSLERPLKSWQQIPKAWAGVVTMLGQICCKAVTSLEFLIWHVEIREENSVPNMGRQVDIGRKLKPMRNWRVGEPTN
jgi:hypothetical protein